MAQVTLSVGGVSYIVGCQDGEEGHLKTLAASISQRLEDVRKTLAPRGDKEALFLVSLLLADELYEAQGKRMTAEEKAALARSQQLEAAHRHMSDRLADAAATASNLLQRVEGHLKTSSQESITAATTTANPHS
ncbi:MULTISPECIES: cell division protein ZapA [Bombella]|uniref:Cell division protein ZapA n=1 Tax=Bombella pollinis TaxID=2967337 RepID=A0ABT3WNQ7_9PROT|nr:MULTISPECIES: cell division protein ZapA [Bombella]MCX5620298.1 cell division protein ZapA [Bombella pollinis]MUG04938.1 cell division protein ZapA [Bombella sp. ESL0378]MUG90487.1 cell division protein ZapA [Bombella sp. ESL0385]